jgi:Radical SAM superfamily
MKKRLLLLTPPFTQLNTPYPATAYLKGFLNTRGYQSYQADLGIEVVLSLFSKSGLTAVFESINEQPEDENLARIYNMRADYIATIEPVITFLQNKNPTLAHSIGNRSYLPEAQRFEQIEDLEWAFGTMGLHDKARHLATLYLEDIGDFIKNEVDEHFGFSRYAERLGRTASSFDEMEAALQADNTVIANLLIKHLDKKMQLAQADVVCISVPFPGNLFGALKCGQHLKAHYPNVQIVFGGGYVNTELRRVTDERLFKYIDFLSLDDGEAPLEILLEYLEGNRPNTLLKRIFAMQHGVVGYYNGAVEKDVPQREVGTPDYSDLLLNDYLSVIEVANPMHRLWSDGRWNKLTLAHGCYWGKCSFCDISLDYIKRYEPVTASLLCDRIEEIIAQTGQTGFHFVDEAAPPVLMRDLALELIKRKISISWWTNIRFENRFTPDLCKLLRASGCIAVSGGLEVASDRLLELMKKGVTVAQVARVSQAFTQSGIMVHAYLMYGFPTQTAQETIDSLENVRQLFETGVLQSGFWHQFAMTAHSPVGLNPSAYQVAHVGPSFAGFAENDYFHEDEKGCDHELFSEGLRVSLFNYMHGVGFELPLSDWFDHKVPRTTVKPDFIQKSVADKSEQKASSYHAIYWLGYEPTTTQIAMPKRRDAFVTVPLQTKSGRFELQTGAETAQFLLKHFHLFSINQPEFLTLAGLKELFEAANLADFSSFEAFLSSYTWQQLRDNGMVVV